MNFQAKLQREPVKSSLLNKEIMRRVEPGDPRLPKVKKTALTPITSKKESPLKNHPKR